MTKEHICTNCNRSIYPSPIAYDYNFGVHREYRLGSLSSKRLSEFFRLTEIDIFVETGTYMGDGVKWALNFSNDKKFSRILSVEHSESLATHSKMLFNKFPSVTIAHGDSVNFLGEIVGSLRTPTMFFLDAHVSGGHQTSFSDEHPIPLVEETNIILNNFYDLDEAIVVIDDERMGYGQYEMQYQYPQIESLEQLYTAKGMVSCYIDDSAVFCNPKWITTA